MVFNCSFSYASGIYGAHIGTKNTSCCSYELQKVVRVRIRQVVLYVLLREIIAYVFVVIILFVF